MFAIYEKDTKKLIGSIGLHFAWPGNKKEPPLKGPYFEVGYWLHKDYHNKGLCTESVNRVVEYSTKELGVKHLTLQCRKDNKASIRVAEKCGFVKVGENEEMVQNKRPDWGRFVQLFFELVVQ